MIIKCQEHYNKVVEYAKSIGDNTLQQCIFRRTNRNSQRSARYGKPDESYAIKLNSFHGWNIHI